MARRPPNKPVDPEDPAAARERALRLLSRREHSARELRHKLSQRGIADEAAAQAVEALAAAGWQSDARYVESMIRQRIGQGYGPLRIESELQQAGVARALIRESLAAAEADWSVLAQETWARRYRAAPTDAAEWQRQYRFLAGRGFDAAHIRGVLKADFIGPD